MCHAEPWFLETPTELRLDESFASAGKIVFCPHNSPDAKWTMHRVRKHSSVLRCSPQKTFHLHSRSLWLSKWPVFLQMQTRMNHSIYIHENSALELMTSNLQPHYSSDAANACIKERFLNKLTNKTPRWPLSLLFCFFLY